MSDEFGILYICPTPIGNLDDMPKRVVDILKNVDLIAAEDTRNTLKLMNRFEIRNKLISYYEHNKAERGEYLIRELKLGKNIAVVSDAGMPGISDPGEDIVRLASNEGIDIKVIPGPSAFVCALVVSGLSTSRFSFEGFLPIGNKERKERFEEIKNDTKTLIFYEAPHKLLGSLEDIYSNLGDRKIVTVREISKIYEEIKRFKVSEAISYYKNNSPKGEFVLVIEGRDKEEIKKEEEEKWKEISVIDHVNMYIEKGISNNEAIKLAAKDRGLKKNEVYKLYVDNKNNNR